MKNANSLFPHATEARSALNMFSTMATPLPAPRIWDMLRSRAVRATPARLDFADGSALVFDNPAAPILAA